MNALLGIADFLIHVLFTLYVYALMIRMLLGLTHADYYNPFSQSILSITNPALRPLHKWVPGFRRLDTAALLLMIAVKLAELLLRGILAGRPVEAGPLIYSAVFGVIDLGLNLYIFAIIVLVVISWISPQMHAQNNPFISVLRSITAPVLRPARRLIPQVGMFDFSTSVVLLALFCAKIFLHSL
ncbi:MAG: YggT family protein [Gammaproteobacteria bacterium]|nr:YggT family protein [Gammaproteobacteria bacterium]